MNNDVCIEMSTKKGKKIYAIKKLSCNKISFCFVMIFLSFNDGILIFCPPITIDITTF